MTLTEECELHEMLGCAICNPRPAPPPVSDSRPFVARYDGQCIECNLPIIAGTSRIVMRERSWAIVPIHEACA